MARAGLQRGANPARLPACHVLDGDGLRGPGLLGGALFSLNTRPAAKRIADIYQSTLHLYILAQVNVFLVSKWVPLWAPFTAVERLVGMIVTTVRLTGMDTIDHP